MRAQADQVNAEVREAEADVLDAAGEAGEPLGDEVIQVGYERSLRDVSDLKAALTRLGAQLENSLKQVNAGRVDSVVLHCVAFSLPVM